MASTPHAPQPIRHHVQMTANRSPRLPSPPLQPPQQRPLTIMVAILVCLGFATGGSSQETNLGVAITQLLALPVALHAAWCLSRDSLPRLAWLALAAMSLILLVPLLQLLPLPEAIWRLPAARQLLAQDLQTAGVDALHYRWTLTPSATLHALLSLLPAVAAFMGALALERRSQRQLLGLLVVLGMISLLLGILQVVGGPGSALILFPQWNPAMSGVFANPNHQGLMLVVTMLLGTGLAADAARRRREDHAPRWAPWPWIGIVVLTILVIPSTGSRAGLLLAVLGMAAVLPALGVIRLRQRHSRRPNLLGLLTILGVVVVGVAATYGWTQADAMGDLRPKLLRATWALGWQHAPLGSGMGSFVQVFAQEAPTTLLQREYINHAHNEYVQWWLEGGLMALLTLVTSLVVLALATLRLRFAGQGARMLAMPALIAVVAFLLHSWVDYPLRTPALMLVAALLAGIVVSTAARTRRSGPAPERPPAGRESR